MKTEIQQLTSTTTPAPEPYIGVEKAAAFLALPTNTVYKLALSRAIPSYKFGKLRRFKLSELATVMESKKVLRNSQMGDR